MSIKAKDELTATAKIIAYNTQAAVLFDDRDDAEDILKSVFIDESNGIIFAAIYKNDKSQFVSKLGNDTPFMPTFDILEKGYNRDGLVISVFEPIIVDDETQGIVCLVASLSGQLEDFYISSGRIIGMSALLIILGYFVSARLQKVITRPITDLLELTKKVGKTSDFSLRGEKKTNDEIGDLVIAFNNMLKQIQERDEELNIANKNLEDKVEQRTSELQNTVEKLNESNQQLQQFTYIASHDLREPVRKISSFGNLLNDSLKNKLNEDDQENLDFMIDGADRMQKMIEALLTYSRVTTKEMDMEDVNLNNIVEQLTTLELAMRIEESNAKINLPEKLPTIKGDSTQIRQLLQNLIGNGLKYIPEDRTPEITIKTSEQPCNMVKIEIQDNGIGIKPEHYENIFVMFRRLHSRSQYEGTGIGLAVCKKIVDRHGGTLGVESEYGEGSTFWFTVKKSDEVIKVENNNKEEQELEKVQS